MPTLFILDNPKLNCIIAARLTITRHKHTAFAKHLIVCLMKSRSNCYKTFQSFTSMKTAGLDRPLRFLPAGFPLLVSRTCTSLLSQVATHSNRCPLRTTTANAHTWLNMPRPQDMSSLRLLTDWNNNSRNSWAWFLLQLTTSQITVSNHWKHFNLAIRYIL